MIIVQNPLITYLTWLVGREIGWADSISTNFFESWRIMDETKKLVEVSKEEYHAKRQAILDYMKATSRGEEWPMPPQLDWEEGDYDYGDDGEDDEYLAGVRLERLVNYLSKFVELNNSTYIVKIALQLFHLTDYMLLSFTTGKPAISLTDYHRNNHIKNLLEGDLESAEKEEQELRLLDEEKVALLATKASWDNFIKEDFNQSVILYYDQVRLYGR